VQNYTLFAYLQIFLGAVFVTCDVNKRIILM